MHNLKGVHAPDDDPRGLAGPMKVLFGHFVPHRRLVVVVGGPISIERNGSEQFDIGVHTATEVFGGTAGASNSVFTLHATSHTRSVVRVGAIFWKRLPSVVQLVVFVHTPLDVLGGSAGWMYCIDVHALAHCLSVVAVGA